MKRSIVFAARAAGACVFAFAASSACLADTPAASGWRPSGVFAQAGVGRDVASVALGASWDFRWQHDIALGRLTAATEVMAAEWFASAPDRHFTQVGILPMLRLYPREWDDGWFVEGGVGANAITPRYRSESRLLLESRENVFLRADADKAVDRSTIDEQAVTSQTQVVLSRDLAREVIRKEGLADKPEFDPSAGGLSPLRAILGAFGIGRSPTEMTKEERTLEAYYDRLNVSAIDKSRVITVDFSSADPDLAARQFMALIGADLPNDPGYDVSDEQLEKAARNAVRTFLRAYGKR